MAGGPPTPPPLRRLTERPDRKSLGVTARGFRDRAGVTGKVVAEATGRSTTAIWRFENGRSLPRDLEAFLDSYCRAVGCTTDQLWQAALGIPPALPEHPAAHAIVTRPFVAAVITFAVFAAIAGAAHSLFRVHGLELSVYEAINVSFLASCLVMLFVVLPRLEGVGPMTRLGSFIFIGGLTILRVYTVWVEVNGDLDPHFISIVATGIAAVGLWATIFGYIAAATLDQGELVARFPWKPLSRERSGAGSGSLSPYEPGSLRDRDDRRPSGSP